MSMKILFRADGDERIGVGHVLRSLALAERFLEQRTVVEFVCRRLSPGLAAKLDASGLTVHRIDIHANPADDCRQLLEIAAAQNAAWIVLDRYELSTGLLSPFIESGRQLLVLDDLGRDDFYHADVIVNPGLSAEQIAYRHPPTATRLLGPQ